MGRCPESYIARQFWGGAPMILNRLTKFLPMVKLRCEDKREIFYLLPKTRASSRRRDKKNLRSFFTAERSPLFLYDLMPGFLKLPHDTILLLSKLKPAERFFCIYLLSKYNQFGNKDFYLTDKQIGEELRVSRPTIWQWRKHLKDAELISYTSGKWEKSATEYHIESCLLPPLPPAKSVKKLNALTTESVKKLNTERKEVTSKSVKSFNINKEVIKQELNQADFISSQPPENWRRDTIRSLN